MISAKKHWPQPGEAEAAKQEALEMQPLPNQPPPAPRILNPHARPEPPPTENEIQYHDGHIAVAPKRVEKKAACAALRQVSADHAAWQAEVAARDAELAKALAHAASIQQQYDSLILDRDELKEENRRFQTELNTCQARIPVLEDWVKQNWDTLPCQDHIEEHARRTFMVERLPGWLSENTAKIAELEKRIAAFAKEHDIRI